MMLNKSLERYNFRLIMSSVSTRALRVILAEYLANVDNLFEAGLNKIS